MKTYQLTKKDLNRLRLAHHGEYDKQTADRIKAVYLLGLGWSVPEVATALLLSENSIRNYYESYQSGGIDHLLTYHYENHSSYLTDDQISRLEAHLEKQVYLCIRDIIAYVKRTFGVKYKPNGMRDLLHRLNFVYKKPKLLPAKPDVAAQKAFIKKYRKIQRECSEEDHIYFADATHPHYQTLSGYGWIKKGQEVKLLTTPTQKPLNIHGAIDVKQLCGIFFSKETSLTCEDTADLLLSLRKKHARGKIYFICDRGSCYWNQAVKEFAKGLGITLVYLPPYSPNLNLIERLWLFLRKNVLYNRRYESYELFCQACRHFFRTLGFHKRELRTLLADNFQICSV